MTTVKLDSESRKARRKLTWPRWLLWLLAVTVWPLLILLFHGVLPGMVSRMAARMGWKEQHPA